MKAMISKRIAGFIRREAGISRAPSSVWTQTAGPWRGRTKEAINGCFGWMVLWEEEDVSGTALLLPTIIAHLLNEGLLMLASAAIRVSAISAITGRVCPRVQVAAKRASPNASCTCVSVC